MANNKTNNFKQAFNELLSGKITSDNQAVKSEAKAPADIDNTPAPLYVEKSSSYAKEETIIGKGVMIEGNVRTDCKLTILGEVTGNVVSTADLVIVGKVGGSIEGNNISLSNCEVKDNITALSNIQLSEGSVVNGNVQAGSIASAGLINGNITAQNVSLSRTSKTIGDISCKVIQIGDGATMKGKIETIE